MKTSEVFRRAKKRLATGFDRDREMYICIAIQKSGAMSRDVRRVQKIIEELLGDQYGTFSSWLRDNGVPYPYHDFRKLQETRHAWVDHLIKHYESIGD